MGREDLAEAIRAWATFAKDHLPPELATSLQGVVDFADRLSGNLRPRVVVAGPFSSGKTTIVNNILGADVLPVGVSETTAIPTLVQHDDEERLMVRVSATDWIEASEPVREALFRSRPGAIGDYFRTYMQEWGYVIYRSPNISREVEILDLPGLSSAYSAIERYIKITSATADGMIYVVSGKQQLTHEDISFLSRLRELGTPIAIAVSHMDLFPPSQRRGVLASVETGARKARVEPVAVVPVEKGKADWGRVIGALRSRMTPPERRGAQTIKAVVDALSEEKRRIEEETRAEIYRVMSPDELEKLVAECVDLIKQAIELIDIHLQVKGFCGELRIWEISLGEYKDWFDGWLQEIEGHIKPVIQKLEKSPPPARETVLMLEESMKGRFHGMGYLTWGLLGHCGVVTSKFYDPGQVMRGAWDWNVLKRYDIAYFKERYQNAVEREIWKRTYQIALLIDFGKELVEALRG